MNNNSFPEYSDFKFWDDYVDQFVNSFNSSKLYLYNENYIWSYFKYCLKIQHRFIFENPLIPIFESLFQEHIYILHKNTNTFRARIDKDFILWKEFLKFSRTKNAPQQIEKLKLRKNVNNNLIEELNETYITEANSLEYLEIKSKVDKGFQGFDAEGCGAPPAEIVTAGRCNPDNVAYLYIAQDEHTAIAEIRPYIGDTVSLATLQPTMDLKLVDLDYEPIETISGKEIILREIKNEFSLVNKGQKEKYYITQYITSLIKFLGYDGICFRSSLVKDGTNYVIFDPSKCNPISSKLLLIPEVKYINGAFKY